MINQDFVQSLHQKAVAIAQDFIRLEHELIDVLQELDEHKAFVHLGYASLFTYATEELKLSENNAYTYIAIARKSREVPALKKEIDSGKLSVSKARRIVPIINKDNAELWITRAKELPKRQLEREIAQNLPEVQAKNGSHYLSHDRLQLEMGVSEELMQKLVQVQDLLSQKRGKHVNLEAALEVLATEYLNRHDPVEKSKRRGERLQKRLEKKKETPSHDIDDVTAFRRYLLGPGRVSWQVLPQWVREDVFHRDGRRCTYVHANGRRCNQQRWLQVHHIIHKAKGGSDDLRNLTTLCTNHHRLMHLHGEKIPTRTRAEQSLGLFA